MSDISFVYVIKWFRVQFGINKHEQIFQRLQKIVVWKICECLFIPNCTRKIIWLLVNNIQVTISVFYVTNGGNQLLQLYWIKIWPEFKRKKSFTLSKSCMKTEQFLLAVFTHCWIMKNLTTKQRKNSLACGFIDAAFVSNVFQVVEKLWAVFTPRRNHSTQYKSLKPKYRETKLKSTRKQVFWALKDIY